MGYKEAELSDDQAYTYNESFLGLRVTLPLNFFLRHPSALLCLPFFSFAVYEVSFISVGYFGKILLILQKRVRWLEESADG